VQPGEPGWACAPARLRARRELSAARDLRDDLKRQDFDFSTGGELRLFGVKSKKLPRLQRADGVVVICGGEVVVVGTPASLHAAIRYFSVQGRIIVQGGDEPSDLLMPPFFRAVRQPILDEKLFHRPLHSLSCKDGAEHLAPASFGKGMSELASMDKNDTVEIQIAVC
jgi:hypothetical protein